MVLAHESMSLPRYGLTRDCFSVRGVIKIEYDIDENIALPSSFAADPARPVCYLTLIMRTRGISGAQSSERIQQILSQPLGLIRQARQAREVRDRGMHVTIKAA